MQARDGDVQAKDGDDDKVVDDRRPHRRREAAARVQDGADQRADAVEEDLRDEEQGKEDRQVQRRGGLRDLAARIQVHDRNGGHGRQQRDASQCRRDQGEHPLVVAVAATGVALGGVHDQRHDDAGEDAAECEVVDDVRQRVGQVVGQPRCRRPPSGGATGRSCAGTLSAGAGGWPERREPSVPTAMAPLDLMMEIEPVPSGAAPARGAPARGPAGRAPSGNPVPGAPPGSGPPGGTAAGRGPGPRGPAGPRPGRRVRPPFTGWCVPGWCFVRCFVDQRLIGGRLICPSIIA